jgi:S1-C subfamily serine protease
VTPKIKTTRFIILSILGLLVVGAICWHPTLPNTTRVLVTGNAQFDANMIEQSTVLVVLPGKGSGSGVAIGSHTILTAGHCVDKNNFIVLSDGTLCIVTHTIMLNGQDAALLFIKETMPCVARIGTDIVAPCETWVYARLLTVTRADSPDALFGWTRGIVSNALPTDLILDQAIYPGMSGGGVFGNSGELVGIVVAKIEDRHNVGKAIPIGVIAKAIADIGFGI